MTPLNLKAITLNCWGIPIISKDRKARMIAIANYLKQGNHNIVCLQEVWSVHDFEYICDIVKDFLPHTHYFYSGVLGSGICILSLWPLYDVFFYQWPLNGYIHKVQHGDWFGGKGVGLCKVKCGTYNVNIYSSHLHAEYDTDDIYLAHRILQAYSTAEFIKLTSETADVIMLAGDLNTEPGNLSFRLICEIANLKDPVCSKDEKHFQYKESGTSGTICNSYSSPAEIKAFPQGKRIDHILYRVQNHNKVLISNYENPLPDRVPNEEFSYSDHNAVSISLIITPGDKLRIMERQNSSTSLCEAITICQEAIEILHNSRKTYLIFSISILLLLVSTVGMWDHTHLLDFVRLLSTVLFLYFLIMGTLWNRIELNSVKAGLVRMQLMLSNISQENESNLVN